MRESLESFVLLAGLVSAIKVTAFKNGFNLKD